MPYGTLKTSQCADAIPVHSPAYPSTFNDYTGIEILSISYRTTADAVQHLLPEELEIEDEPLATANILRYGMSRIGPYTEFVQSIEVKYNGVLYDYVMNLILDNQSAIFSGRERFGMPKTFGSVVFNPSEPARGSGGFISGKVQRPFGTTIAVFGFKPQEYTPFGPLKGGPKSSLGLRVIPSPVIGDPPSLREFIPMQFDLHEGEVWKGQGSLGFSEASTFDFCLPVKKYEKATFIRRGAASIRPITRDEVFKV